MQDFYIYRTVAGKFEPVDAEPVKIEGYDGFDFFVHLNADNEKLWNVSEGISGATIAIRWHTKEQAIIAAKEKLSTLKQKEIEGLIKEWALRHDISPMYLSRLLPSKRKG